MVSPKNLLNKSTFQKVRDHQTDSPKNLAINGDDIKIGQVIELYEIDPTCVQDSGRFIDFEAVECFHWNDGEGEVKLFSQDIN